MAVGRVVPVERVVGVVLVGGQRGVARRGDGRRGGRYHAARVAPEGGQVAVVHLVGGDLGAKQIFWFWC